MWRAQWKPLLTLTGLLMLLGTASGDESSARITPPGNGDPVNESNGVVTMRPMTAGQMACSTVKVAAVQLDGSPAEDLAAKVVAYIERAAKDGAQLVAFPEYLLGKLPATAPAVARVREAARNHRIYVVVGLFEIIDDSGRFGNCAMLIGRDGEILGRYFKVHPAIGGPPYFWPPKPEDTEQQMAKGDAFPVFDLDFGRVGILTCYDGYFPETFRILALKGAEILVWINSRGGAIEDYLVKTAMVQNYVHVVGVNQAIGAGTTIAQWPTHILQVASNPGETYLCDQLDMSSLRTARKDGGREFHQRRPDLYGELLKTYPVWEQYVSIDPSVPPTKSSEPIELTPVAEVFKKRADATHDGEDLFRIGFRARAPWMTNGVELRFPEVLQSSLGMHLLDHYSARLTTLSELEPLPRWERDDATGTLAYAAELPEGIAFAAKATPSVDMVRLEFSVTNRTDKTLGFVEQNSCLNLGTSPELGARADLTRLWSVFDGALRPLSTTTPTPADMKRDPWLLILTPSGKDTFNGPKVSPTWWRVDQVADSNLMAATSADGKHLLGYTWDREGPHMMSNGGNPCLHAGPAAATGLEPGATHTWRGAIYLLDNNPDSLLARFRADKEAWAK